MYAYIYMSNRDRKLRERALQPKALNTWQHPSEHITKPCCYTEFRKYETQQYALNLSTLIALRGLLD